MWSLSDDFHQHTFATLPVELPVKDLFPRTEIQLAFRYGYDDLAPHNRTLQVRIGIILSIVMIVLGRRLVRRQLLQPPVEIAIND